MDSVSLAFLITERCLGCLVHVQKVAHIEEHDSEIAQREYEGPAA